MGNKFNNQNTDLLVKEEKKIKKPNMYSVVLINDDYTPMEFVIYVLQTIFRKEYEDAKKIMLSRVNLD